MSSAAASTPSHGSDDEENEAAASGSSEFEERESPPSIGNSSEEEGDADGGGGDEDEDDGLGDEDDDENQEEEEEEDGVPAAVPVAQLFLGDDNQNEMDSLSSALGGEVVSIYAAGVDPVPNPPTLPKKAPAKPDQSKMKALKPPACFKSGHAKCKQAFEKERERAEYARAEAEKQSSYVHQYHGQLVTTSKTNQDFMKKQQRMMAAKEKRNADQALEITKLKNELAVEKKKSKSADSLQTKHDREKKAALAQAEVRADDLLIRHCN